MSADLETIQRILGGDPEAFRLLVVRYQGPLFCLIRNLLGDAHEAEDVAQDVFLAAYHGLRSYDPNRAAFSTWLFTIARNRCRNARGKRRPVLLEELPETPGPPPPDTALVEAEWFQRLNAALDALPFEQKTVFVLSEIQGLPLAEVSRIEGVPVGTVKSRLSRARAKLQSLLRPTAEQL